VGFCEFLLLLELEVGAEAGFELQDSGKLAWTRLGWF